jgi:hypothetical protein
MRIGFEVAFAAGVSLDAKDRMLSDVAITTVKRLGYQGWYVAERTKFYFGNQKFADTFEGIVAAY